MPNITSFEPFIYSEMETDGRMEMEMEEKKENNLIKLTRN